MLVFQYLQILDSILKHAEMGFISEMGILIAILQDNFSVVCEEEISGVSKFSVGSDLS